jgi:hypothetical protein
MQKIKIRVFHPWDSASNVDVVSVSCFDDLEKIVTATTPQIIKENMEDCKDNPITFSKTFLRNNADGSTSRFEVKADFSFRMGTKNKRIWLEKNEESVADFPATDRRIVDWFLLPSFSKVVVRYSVGKKWHQNETQEEQRERESTPDFLHVFYDFDGQQTHAMYGFTLFSECR